MKLTDIEVIRYLPDPDLYAENDEYDSFCESTNIAQIELSYHYRRCGLDAEQTNKFVDRNVIWLWCYAYWVTEELAMTNIEFRSV